MDPNLSRQERGVSRKFLRPDRKGGIVSRLTGLQSIHASMAPVSVVTSLLKILNFQIVGTVGPKRDCDWRLCGYPRNRALQMALFLSPIRMANSSNSRPFVPLLLMNQKEELRNDRSRIG